MRNFAQLLFVLAVAIIPCRLVYAETGPAAPLDNIAKTRSITSRYNGETYESCITPQQFDAMPSWDPMGHTPIPVDPGRAIRLARAIFEQRVPETERRNWVLARVELLHDGARRPSGGYVEAGAQKWHYVVHFWNTMNPEVATFPTPPAIRAKQDELNIFVLLSGEACKLVARPRKQAARDVPVRESKPGPIRNELLRQPR
jgi:hypothetical protein